MQNNAFCKSKVTFVSCCAATYTCSLHIQNYSGLQSVVHCVSEVRLRPPAVLLQPARAVLMNSEIHDECGHMVEPAGQARGAS